MSQNIISTVNARIDELLAQRDAEIVAAEQAVAEAKAALEEARNRVGVAVVSTDVDAYAAALADAEKAEMAVTLYTKRLEQLQGKQIVTDAENDSVMSEIRAMQKTLMRNASSEIVELLSQIETIGKKYWEEQNAMDKLAVRWHSEIRPQIHPRFSRGYADPNDVKANDGGLRRAIEKYVTDWFYRDQLGVDQYNGYGSFWTK